ncbi:hypothetical protein [Salinicola rhizosphaerae]|uniref:Uncharacterized protein n=1 Tax=Salinicola rhizosphaerae TaxID=1443141 RepID=A0ABQ3E942_9GAMM|nr:hypothetical protein [Salinicola rhizosphaerae]GHB23304.1 hypothetical protein GCM10009038_22580 [Salinicola rhizosphaerae]
MSRASIFDRLHERQRPVDVVEAPTLTRDDFETARLRFIDGVALTPSGFVARGSTPEAGTPALSHSLYGPDGFRLLVHEVVDVMSVDDSRLGRLEAKALRLHALIQTIVIEALMLLESLPEETPFDVVLTAPLRSSEATGIVVDHLRDAIAETQYGAVLGEITLREQGGDPHAALAVNKGMSHVLWINADSSLNGEDISRLQRDGLIGRRSSGGGLYPGEAVTALLVQRLLPGESDFAAGWIVNAGTSEEQAPRSERREYLKRQQMVALLGGAWPQGDESDVTETESPACVVIDAMALAGRAAEVGGALIERWPEIDLIDDGIGVDGISGWPGQGMTALSFCLALSALEPEASALVLSVVSETRSVAWKLQACAAEAAPTDVHS